MSNQDPLRNWQLEKRGADPEQWKLQDAEQDLSKHMQLQPDETSDSQWRPVEYERTTRPRSRNWVLPSIVIAALLAVLGYVGWIALNQFGGAPFNFDPGQLAAGIGGAAVTEPTPAETIAAAVVTEAPTAAPPTRTAVPTAAPTATAMPEPTPTLSLAELITGTVNAVGGVNARNAPATTGEVLRLLNQGAAVTALEEQEGWLQLLFEDNTTAWVAAEFVDVVRQQAPLAQVNELRARAGLAPLGEEATAVPAETPAEAAVTLPLVVIGQPVINARLTPALDGTVVQSLNVSTTLTAIGRTAAGDWLAVQLPEGSRAWVLATLVATTGATAALPVLDAASFTATAPVTTTLATTDTTRSAPLLTTPTLLATNGVIPAAPFTNTLPATGPALTISDTAGVNVRATPSREAAVLTVAPNGAVLPVTGRTADGAWLQVSVPDGQTGWVFAQAVIASADAATAPVSDATPAAAPATPAGPTAVATITNPLGANLRSAPSRDLDPIVTFSKGDTLTAVGRSADNEWVQVALPDGTLAWALATTLQLDASIETLAVTQE